MTPLIETFTPNTLAQRTSDPAYWEGADPTPDERERELQAIIRATYEEEEPLPYQTLFPTPEEGGGPPIHPRDDLSRIRVIWKGTPEHAQYLKEQAEKRQQREEDEAW